MYAKILKKSRLLMTLTLLVCLPIHVQATESSTPSQGKKLVIPNFALMHLTKKLGKLSISDAKKSSNLFETIYKLRNTPTTLTQQEKRNLSQYVAEETLQLGKALGSSKEDETQQCMQKTRKELIGLLNQIQPQHKPLVLEAVYRRRHELLIPADGHCLYTTIILDYLLPAVNQPNVFKRRLRTIMDKKTLPITHDEFASHYHDLHYLHSDTAFQQVICGLLKQINIQPGTWGGPKEIKLIAQKFNLNIQEYTPDPDNPKQLIKGDLTEPKNWLIPHELTLHIVQDTPLEEELINSDDDPDLQQGQRSSLQSPQHRHHYRPYYTSELPRDPQKQQKDDNKAPEQKHLPQKDTQQPIAPKITHINPPQSPSYSHNLLFSPRRPSLSDLLQTHYATKNQLPGLLGDMPQSLACFYIHLAILTEKEHQVKKQKFLKKQPDANEEEGKEDRPQQDNNPEQEKNWQKSLNYAALHEVQKLIKLEGLWKPQENQQKSPRHVVITGEAGTGKSTLSQYIAYQWAKGNLWSANFTWVLQIPLRKIRNLHDQQNSYEQIAACLSIPNLEGSHLQNLLTRGEPGLLILDGYDEVVSEVEKKSPFSKWLQQCFQNTPQLSIILTTRPATHCPYLQRPRYLRVLGFQQQDIDRYVKTYFPPEVQQNNTSTPPISQKAKELLQVLQKNPTLKLLSHTPLYLRLLCILAKQQGFESLEQCSTPQLYQQIIGQFLCYNLARHNNKALSDYEQASIFRNYGLELAYLGELAFEGMKRGQAVLPIALQKQLLRKIRLAYPRKSYTEPDYWGRIVSLGLLQGYTSRSSAPDQATYFPHLTLQEWLAASYLVTALYKKRHIDHDTAKKIINHHKYLRRYQVMLPFMAGICYQHIMEETDPQGKGLMAFWTFLEAEPRELIGIHHALLVARCLEACHADTSSNLPEDVRTCHEALIKQVATWLQAFLDYEINLRDISHHGSVWVPLETFLRSGLQGCPLLLHHTLIINQVKLLWPSLSLKQETSKGWHARLAKISPLAQLPLSHHTAIHLATYACQAIDHNDWRVRCAAVGVLPQPMQALKPNDSPVLLKPIKKALTNRNEDVRAAALKALPKLLKGLQPQDKAALLNPFKKALADASWLVRKTAVRALPQLLKALNPEDALNWLKKTLADHHEDVREVAVEVIPPLFEALKPQDRFTLLKLLNKALTDKSWLVRRAAIEAIPLLLQALQPQDIAAFLNPMKKALADHHDDVRKATIQVLPQLLKALRFQDMLNWLKHALADKDKYIRIGAVSALPQLLKTLKTQYIFGWIKKALADQDWIVQKAALNALPKLLKHLQPKKRGNFIEAIKKALENDDWGLREAALKALPKLLKALKPQESNALFKPVKQALKDYNQNLRRIAVETLSKFFKTVQPQDRRVLFKYAKKAFADYSQNLQEAATEALPQLLKALKDQDEDILLAPFKKALEDDNWWARYAAVRVLPQLLQTLQPQERCFLLKPLKKALEDEEWQIREAALRALPLLLEALMPKDRLNFLKPIEKSLTDEEWQVRTVAVGALPELLQALQPEDIAVLLRLFKKALEDDNTDVRAAAVKTVPQLLSALKPQYVASLLKPLKKALADEEWPVRSAAHQALLGITDEVWKEGLKHQLQARPFVPRQQGVENMLKAALEDWAYLLLHATPLICFSKTAQGDLTSYKLLLEALKKQATTWNWPLHAYTAQRLLDNFDPRLPKLPAIAANQPLAYTLLHQAAQQGNVNELKALWKDRYYHRFLNDQHNQANLTPLLCALINQQWEAAAWLINQGAWLDVASTHGDTCLQLLLGALKHHNTSSLAQLVITLLSKRTLFPIDRIQRSLRYAEEKKQSHAAYDQELCATVAQFLGEPTDVLHQLVYNLKNRALYRAASQNMLEGKQKGDEKITFTQGWDMNFLKFRIAVLYDLLVKVKKKHFILEFPTKKNTKEHYSSDEVYQKGLQELQVILTTFWDNKSLKGCLGTPKFYQAWAEGIIHRLPSLSLPQEISLALGHQGHCIYLNLAQTPNHYIIRIDNRWIKTAPKKSHPLKKQALHQKEITCLKPYAVAYFPVQAWNKHKAWLLTYIMRAGQLNGQQAPKVIPHLYQTEKKAPKIGNKPTWAKKWPWRPLSTTADNSFMRSQSVGGRIRLGNDLYKWFRKESSDSYLLAPQLMEKHLSVSSSISPRRPRGTTTNSSPVKGNHLKGNYHKKLPPKAPKPGREKIEREKIEEEHPSPPPKQKASPTKLPTHQEMVQSFSQQLLVDSNAICKWYEKTQEEHPNPQPKQKTSSTTLPTHQEMVQTFSQQLLVNHNAICKWYDH